MIKNIIIGILFVTTSFYCLSDSNPRNEQLVEYLKVEYLAKLKQLENKMILCQKTNNSISPQDLKSTLRTWDEISIVLEHFYAKTQYQCSKEELKKLTLASAELLALDSSDKKILDAQNYIVMNGPLAFHKTKLDFLTLPENVRKKLGEISKLQEPFNMLDTMENFGY
jgi:hypothetical protein